MTRRLASPAVRARLTAVCTVFGLEAPEDRSGGDALLDLVTAAHPTVETRSAIALLAVTGRYPSHGERDRLATLLGRPEADHEHVRIRRHLEAAARATPRRIRHAPCVVVTGTIVDITRTAESISPTGVPRVVRALARRGRARGATLIAWRSGCPVVFEGALFEDAGGSALAGTGSRSRLTAKARIRLLGWRLSQALGRVPGVVPVASRVSDWLQRASLAHGFRRSRVAILGAGEIVIAETPDAITSERLAVWRETMPSFAITPFIHDVLPISHPQFFPSETIKDFRPFLTLALDSPMVITSTKAVADELRMQAAIRGTWPGPDIHVIGFGSDAAAWRPTPLARSGKPMFLTVGGFDDRKNVASLLSALIELARHGQAVGVRIVAQSMTMTGATRSLISHAEAAGVEVEIHCRISDALMAAFIDQAPACVYLSRAEGYGLPIVESLVRGTPVVASDIPSARELAAYGGVQLVPLDDLQALAHALRVIASDPVHRARLCAAIDRAAIPPGLAAWAAEIIPEPAG